MITFLARTMRRALVTAYPATAAVVFAAVAPLAAGPACARAPIPGTAVAASPHGR